MEELNLLPETATLQETKEAIAALPAPGPRKICRALEIEHIAQSKYLNLNKMFQQAKLADIIVAYNELQIVKAGNIKALKQILEMGKEGIQELFPIIELLVENKGKISLDEIRDFIGIESAKKQF